MRTICYFTCVLLFISNSFPTFLSEIILQKLFSTFPATEVISTLFVDNCTHKIIELFNSSRQPFLNNNVNKESNEVEMKLYSVQLSPLMTPIRFVIVILATLPFIESQERFWEKLNFNHKSEKDGQVSEQGQMICV